MGAIVILLILIVLIYRRTALWEPDQSLLTLLPGTPICYVSVKDLGSLIETFQRSELGVQTAQMPILAEIRRELWWRRLMYQKQRWELEMGGTFDLKRIRGYLGEEAILGVYQRDSEIAFLLITVLGAKEKLEIATLTATAPVNPKYKRLKENYRKLDINTITGYPQDFSYAFIGKVGLLATDKSLIQDTVDIYAERKQSFTALAATGKHLHKQYDTARNTIYINHPKLAEVLKLDEPLKSLLQGIDVWMFSNHYEDGVIYSRHRMARNTNSQPRQSPRSVDEKLFSMLPATTAFLNVSNDADLTGLWKQMKANLPLQYQRNGIDLSSHLESRIALAMFPPPAGVPALVPSILLICPVQDRAGLEAALSKLKRSEIAVNGKPLRFPSPLKHQGVELQPIQLQLGLIFALKGGYALVDNYWVVGTTLGGVQSAINAFTGGEVALASTTTPDHLQHSSHSYIRIQPNLLIPELKRLLPIAGLMFSQQIDTKLIRRITDNLSPLEALGLITAGINFNDDFVETEIQIILEGE